MTITNPNLDTVLVNPRLSLFAFHFCKELTQDETLDSKDIWLRCAEVGKLLHIPEVELLPQLISSNGSQPENGFPLSTLLEKFTELLPQQHLINFCNLATDKLPNRQGGIYPFRLHDTNTVDFTISYECDRFPIDRLKYLNPQGCFLPDKIDASLGQTLLLFDRRLNSTDNDVKIAQASIESFVSPSDDNLPLPKLIGQGKFLGSNIYEFKNDILDPTRRVHFLVWFATSAETITQENSGNYCVPLYQMLCSRHKIQFAYYQARQVYKQARQLYGEIEPVINSFSKLKTKQNEWLKAQLAEIKTNTRDRKLRQQIELLLSHPESQLSDSIEQYIREVSNKRLEAKFKQSQQIRLQKLENWLIQIPQKSVDYARCLRDMQTNLTTIAINALNYNRYVNRLQELALPEDDLGFWTNFLEEDCNQYREQIGYDLEYLMSGKALFDRTIDSIRGLVAIDAQKQRLVEDMAEDERDRRIELWVTVVGSGLAVSALTSAIMPEPVQLLLKHYQIEYEHTWYGNQGSLLAWNVIFHSAIGILAAILVAIVFRSAIESFSRFLGNRIRRR